MKNGKKISVTTRGYMAVKFEIRTELNGPVIGEIPIEFTNLWEVGTAEVSIPDGVYALYFTLNGSGNGQMKSITIE